MQNNRGCSKPIRATCRLLVGRWYDQSGTSTVEFLAVIACVLGLLIAVMAVMQTSGSMVGSQLVERFTCFLNRCASQAQPSQAVPSILASTQSPGQLTQAVTGLPRATLGWNPTPQVAMLVSLSGVFAVGGFLASSGAAPASAGAEESQRSGWLPSLLGAWYAANYSQLPRQLLATARTYMRINPDTFRGRITEVLWRAYHNANPLRLVRHGWAWLNSNPNLRDWDGGFTGLRGRILVQLKSVRPTIATYRQTIGTYARMAIGYGRRQLLLVNSESARDLVRNIADRIRRGGVPADAVRRVGSSGVSSAEATVLGELARDVARGSRPFWQLPAQIARRAAGRAGVFGAVLSGGLSIWQNIRDARAGRIATSEAVVRIAVDTAGGALSAGSGALAGAAIGSIVPGVGTVVGAVIGFVVGFIVSAGVQTLWDSYVREPVVGWLLRRVRRRQPAS